MSRGLNGCCNGFMYNKTVGECTGKLDFAVWTQIFVKNFTSSLVWYAFFLRAKTIFYSFFQILYYLLCTFSLNAKMCKLHPAYKRVHLKIKYKILSGFNKKKELSNLTKFRTLFMLSHRGSNNSISLILFSDIVLIFILANQSGTSIPLP